MMQLEASDGEQTDEENFWKSRDPPADPVPFSEGPLNMRPCPCVWSVWSKTNSPPFDCSTSEGTSPGTTSPASFVAQAAQREAVLFGHLIAMHDLRLPGDKPRGPVASELQAGFPSCSPGTKLPRASILSFMQAMQQAAKMQAPAAGLQVLPSPES